MTTATQQMPLVRIHGVEDVRVDSVPVPECGPNDIIVAVQHCGICGSDLGYIAMGGMGPENPMPLGHEMSARVKEVGAHVHSVKAGDRVVVNPMVVEPAIGNFGSEGGFAPWLLVREVAGNPMAALPVPDELDDLQAALVEPLSVAMHGVHQGEVTASDKVVIMGAGTIGLSMAMVLNYYGVRDTVIVDTCESRLQVANSLGLRSFEAGGDLAAFLCEHHGSVKCYGADVPATDVYLEATGVGAVFEDMLRLAKMNARLVVVGVHKAPVSLDLVTVLSKELSIKGALAYPREFPEVIEMLASGKVSPEVLVTHRYPLSEFTQALAMAKNTQQAIKVMIDCQS